MIQNREFAALWINGCSAGTFSQGTRHAGQGKIIEIRWSTIDSWDDVIDVKRRFLADL